MFCVLDKGLVNSSAWTKFSWLAVFVSGVFIRNTATPIHHILSTAALSYKDEVELFDRDYMACKRSLYCLTLY